MYSLKTLLEAPLKGVSFFCINLVLLVLVFSLLVELARPFESEN